MKSNTEIAREVIDGKWGNGDIRRRRLEAAGYNYDVIQAEVNRLCGTKPSTDLSITAVARQVIGGRWGNGPERKKRLEAAGYNYDEVQKEVNRLIALGVC